MDSLFRATDMAASMDPQQYRNFTITFCSQVHFSGSNVGVVSGRGLSWLVETCFGSVHRSGESCGCECLGFWNSFSSTSK